MNTAEINQALAKKLGKTQKETSQILEAAAAVLTDALKAGDVYTVPGLGTFGTKIRAGRNAFNPAAKKIEWLPAVKTVQFHSSVGLKQKVQVGSGENE